MKLIKCNDCGDVVRLTHDKWRMCSCGSSGGQYNEDLTTATVGGNCEVIGLRNDFFDEKPFSKKREGKDKIIQGEYKGDTQIHRIKSPKGPRLNIRIKNNKDNTHDVIFKDKRDYKINVDGNKSPKKVKNIPSVPMPSFKLKFEENFKNMKNKTLLKEKLSEIKSKLKTIEESTTYSEISDLIENFEKLLREIVKDFNTVLAIEAGHYRSNLIGVLSGLIPSKIIIDGYKEKNKNLEKFIKLYPNVKLNGSDASDVIHNQSKQYPLKTFEDTIKSQKVGKVISKL